MATTSTLSPLLHSSRKELGQCWEAFVFGANPTIEFEDFMQFCQRKFDFRGVRALSSSSEQNQRTYRTRVQQPVVLAAEYDLPRVVQELLRRNVNANTLEKSGHGGLLSPQPSVFGRRGTLLDVVERKLKNLREHDVMKVDEAFPEGLQHDGYYIGDIEEGTYQHWSAKDLELARSIVRNMQVELEQKLLVRKQPGLEEKREALRGLIRDFEEAETMLIERGGKLSNSCTVISRHRTNLINTSATRRSLSMSVLISRFQIGQISREKASCSCEFVRVNTSPLNALTQLS
ncbi:MAG: hypothetical protein M1830_006507, partial [Pleopsidium flavum]